MCQKKRFKNIFKDGWHIGLETSPGSAKFRDILVDLHYLGHPVYLKLKCTEGKIWYILRLPIFQSALPSSSSSTFWGRGHHEYSSDENDFNRLHQIALDSSKLHLTAVERRYSGGSAVYEIYFKNVRVSLGERALWYVIKKWTHNFKGKKHFFYFFLEIFIF